MLYFFFFNDTATTEIYTLSLHDALPIFYMDAYWATINALKEHKPLEAQGYLNRELFGINSKLLLDIERIDKETLDRKSTRLNSSHSQISYAVFCLKKKKPELHYQCYIDS